MTVCVGDCVTFLGIRGAKLISVYNFTAKWRASFKNQSILNFRVYSGAWHKATIDFLEKYILIS